MWAWASSQPDPHCVWLFTSLNHPGPVYYCCCCYYYYYYCVYSILSACMPACQKRAPHLLTDGCEPPCGYWKLDSSEDHSSPASFLHPWNSDYSCCLPCLSYENSVRRWCHLVVLCPVPGIYGHPSSLTYHWSNTGTWNLGERPLWCRVCRLIKSSRHPSDCDGLNAGKEH